MSGGLRGVLERLAGETMRIVHVLSLVAVGRRAWP